MKGTLIVAIVLLFGISFKSQAQTQAFRLSVSQEWVHLSSDTLLTQAVASKSDIWGNTYILGLSYDSLGYSDVILEKVNSSTGETYWKFIYDGGVGRNDYAADFELDDSLNIYIACGITRDTTDKTDYGVLKVNGSGSLVWTYSTHGDSASNDACTGLYLDYSGGIYATGFVTNMAGDEDILTKKLTVNGNVQWSRLYNSSRDYGVDITYIIPEDVILVVGLSEIDTSHIDINAHRINPTNGSLITTNSSGSIDRTGVELNGIQRNSLNSDIYVYGKKWDATNSMTVGYVMAFDSLLNQNWTTEYAGNDSVYAVFTSICEGDSGKFYCVGHVLDSLFITRPVVVCINDNGLVNWNKELTWFTGSFEKVIRGDSNLCFATGQILRESGFDLALFSIRWDTTVAFEAAIDGPQSLNDFGHYLSFGKSNELFVTGAFEKSLGNYNYQTIKYDIAHFKYLIPENDTSVVTQPGRIIVRFAQNSILNTASTNNVNKVHSRVGDFIAGSTVELMKAKIDTGDVDISYWYIEKAIPWLTPKDTLSVTRWGDTIRIPSLFAYMIIHLPESYNESIVADSLSKLDSLIIYANVMEVGGVQPTSGPNDEFYNTQHGLFSTSYPNGHINIEDAWIISTGNSDVKIGIIDEGISFLHDELKYRVIDGYNFVYNKSIFDMDYNNYHNTSTHAAHATAVAGIIGAKRNNSGGIAGIAGGDNSISGVSLYNGVLLDALNPKGKTTMLAAFTGMIIDKPVSSGDPAFGCHITNGSFGMVGVEPVQELDDIFTLAHLNGALVVQSMGNENENIDDNDYHFASGKHFKDEYCIMVGAFGTSGEKESYSNYGGNIDILAPGASVLIGKALTYKNGYREGFNRTSSAAPHVSGVAGLILSYYFSNRTAYGLEYFYPEDIEKIIENSSTDLTGTGYSIGWDALSGHGQLNAGLALQSIESPDYKLFHFEETTNLSDFDVTVIETEREIDIKTDNGIEHYVADVLQVESTFDFSSSLSGAGYSFYTGWKLLRNSSGLGNLNFIDPYRTHVELVSLTSTEITLRTYVYKLKRRVYTTGDEVVYVNPIWYPSSLPGLKFGFTIHGGTGFPLRTETPAGVSFSIFPNPATNIVNVKGLNEYIAQKYSTDFNSGDILVYSIDGKLLHQQSILFDSVDDIYSIDTDRLTNGSYFIRFSMGGSSIPLGKISVIR